jgi:hypothetical protein
MPAKGAAKKTAAKKTKPKKTAVKKPQKKAATSGLLTGAEQAS